MRVLIAEDEPVSRKRLEFLLCRWGYEVISVADGEEAWRVLSGENPPRLAILDWVMPGLDGVSLCRKIRNQRSEPYIYILLLTVRDDDDSLVEAMNAGADDFVNKPFKHHELKARLRAGQRIGTLQRDLIETREALREQATHDALTDCWNRRAILHMLERELSHTARTRSGPGVGVLIADLDHFKVVNDTHGHLVGDEVLRETVRRFEQQTRSYDSVGRLGGEEFLLLLTDCNHQQVVAAAERLRNAIEEKPVETSAGPVHLSISVGSASIATGEVIPTREALSIADSALYAAKSEGRNRCRCVNLQPEGLRSPWIPREVGRMIDLETRESAILAPHAVEM